MLLLRDSPRGSASRRSQHPLIAIAWVAAGLIVATGFGPWLSHFLGLMLPAFAVIRTTPSPDAQGGLSPVAPSGESQRLGPELTVLRMRARA